MKRGSLCGQQRFGGRTPQLPVLQFEVFIFYLIFVGSTTGPRSLKKGAVPCQLEQIFSSGTQCLTMSPKTPTPELLLADMSEEEDSVQPMEVTVTSHESLQLRSTFNIQRIARSDGDIHFYTMYV